MKDTTHATSSALIRFTCPRCQLKIRAPRSMCGRLITCRRCGESMQIPKVSTRHSTRELRRRRHTNSEGNALFDAECIGSKGETEPSRRPCPHCAQPIAIRAVPCKLCNSHVEPSVSARSPKQRPSGDTEYSCSASNRAQSTQTAVAKQQRNRIRQSRRALQRFGAVIGTSMAVVIALALVYAKSSSFSAGLLDEHASKPYISLNGAPADELTTLLQPVSKRPVASDQQQTIFPRGAIDQFFARLPNRIVIDDSADAKKRIVEIPLCTVHPVEVLDVLKVHLDRVTATVDTDTRLGLMDSGPGPLGRRWTVFCERKGGFPPRMPIAYIELSGRKLVFRTRRVPDVAMIQSLKGCVLDFRAGTRSQRISVR